MDLAKTARLRAPSLGVLVAIAVTTTMDANGLSAFSALPLCPLMALFWYLERLPKRSVGFVWGRKRDYAVATLHPLCVLGAMAAISFTTGVIDFSHTNWRKALLNLILVSCSTFVVAIVTEEGFFRGWLWASLERAGVKQPAVLIWSSAAFSLWHLSAVSLKTGFDIPAAQIPVFMINAAVIGAVWGLLRWISGSVIVASLSHGLWNGMDYVFFGFGAKIGALGIKNTALYGPEVGVLGLALNIAFLAALWRRWKLRSGA
jgi:membrane protease YdiL (CAAX protease family)